ncbi:Uncharacterized protein HZ326_2426 [Fusarium oxysporum f. sp. albedinis]|nr:Uncharacterized protein HZ326_2426 [Fusarium oxysporum f. sp. albedinis]
MDPTARNEQLLDRRSQLTEGLSSLPYDLILYLNRAAIHSDLGYPDLAAGDAYRALLLADEVLNEGFEYHEQALESLQMHTAVPLPDVLAHGNLPQDELQSPETDLEVEDEAVKRLAILAQVRAYQILSLGLLLCGSLQSAASFCQRGLQLSPSNQELLDTKNNIVTVARRRLRRDDIDIDYPNLPDQGLVRREVYPWNDHEPDRFAPESLAELNERCAEGILTSHGEQSSEGLYL